MQVEKPGTAVEALQLPLAHSALTAQSWTSPAAHEALQADPVKVPVLRLPQHTWPALQSVLSSQCTGTPVTHPGKDGKQDVGKGGKQFAQVQHTFDAIEHDVPAQLMAPGEGPCGPSVVLGASIAASASAAVVPEESPPSPPPLPVPPSPSSPGTMSATPPPEASPTVASSFGRPASPERIASNPDPSRPQADKQAAVSAPTRLPDRTTPRDSRIVRILTPS
jgi:hypothetical protein